MYESISERYRRYRAVKRYEYAVRFWFLDSFIFLIKLLGLLLTAAMITNLIMKLPEYPSNILSASQNERLRHLATSADTQVSPQPITISNIAPQDLQITDSAQLIPAESTAAKASADQPNYQHTANFTIQPTAGVQTLHQQTKQSRLPAKPLAKGRRLPVLTIKADNVNLRSAPQLHSNVLARFNKGAQVTFFEVDGDWVEVGTNDIASITGYIHVSLLEEQNLAPDLLTQ